MYSVKIRQQIVSKALFPMCIFDEAVINFTSDSMYVEGKDKSNSIRIHVSIPKDTFTTYNINEFKIGINTIVINILECLFDESSKLQIKIDKSTKKMIFVNDNSSFTHQGPDTSHCSVKPIDKKDTLQGKLTIRKSINNLLKSIKLANDIATHAVLKFPTNQPAIIMCANGDIDKIENKVIAHDAQINRSWFEQDGLVVDAESKYPLEKLIEITKILPTNKSLKIAVTDRDELVISYPVIDNIGEVYIKLAGSIS